VKTYEDGLREAWDLAQRIALAPSIRADAYKAEELEAIFGEGYYENVLSLSFDDVQKLLSTPKVGDVYNDKYSGEKCVITHVADNSVLNYLRSGGVTGVMFAKSFLTSGWQKTGENLSEITAILDKLRGEKSV
jgi:hypothetical protein